MRRHRIFTFALLAIAVAAFSPSTARGQSVADILKAYRPAVSGVEYDTPTAADIAQCRAELETTRLGRGYVVYDPAGRVLRRFTDTNGDTKPDLFRYYRMGLEVYRDIDSNNNEKPDQHRWMNWGGTRWAIDANEDGRIEEWRRLSAEEAARISAEAAISGNMGLLQSVMLTASDIRVLSVTDEVAKQLAEAGTAAAADLQTATKALGSGAEWLRFEPPAPSLIPADAGKSKRDLVVYENAMALVKTSKDHSLLSIGEMVQVGEVWKVVTAPRVMQMSGTEIQPGGILMQPELTGPGSIGPEFSREMQEFLVQLQKLDAAAPTPGDPPAALERYNRERSDILQKIANIAPDREGQRQWLMQLADGLAAWADAGQSQEALNRLKQLEKSIAEDEIILSYTVYRRLLGEYSIRSADESKRAQTDQWWLDQLEAYARKWPKAQDSSEVMAQLAVSLELQGRVDDATRWYQQLTKDHPETNPGIRARGALRRLNLGGKELDIAGTSLNGQSLSTASYRGKVLLVIFWATWCEPCTKDLPQVRALYAKYRSQGFEVMGVNVNSDNEIDEIPAYLRQHQVPWEHVRDQGGLQSGTIARDFGIISVPTMFLVDRGGRVAGTISTADLDEGIQSLLAGKQLGAARRTQVEQ